MIPTEEERWRELRRERDESTKHPPPHNRKPVDASLADLARRRERRRGAQTGREMLRDLQQRVLPAGG